MSLPIEAANLQTGGLTLQQYAETKQLPVPFLRQLGVHDGRSRGAAALCIPYADQLGKVRCVRLRTAMKGQRFLWRTGTKPCAYGLDRLEDARQANHCTFVEGESDAQTLWHHEQPAIGLPGATAWQDVWASLFAGIETIYVVVEPDRGGSALVAKLAKSPLRPRIHCIRLCGHKDVSDLHCHSPDNFKAAWAAAKKKATALAEMEKAQDKAQAEEDEKRCHALARSTDILGQVTQSTLLTGFVGETNNLKILYLAITSRLLSRPVSVVVKGPSSAGKSAVVDRALCYFPPEAYYAISSMTERAMVYSEEPLANRTLVVYEAAGMKGELASYLIRSLLSEGRIRYETVEKTPEGMRPRFIEREGPTGLVVTTTSIRLHPENETRMLSLLATDNPVQTSAVMAAMAKRHAGGLPPPTDFEPWHALQRCLARGGVEVTIPFAEAIAAGIHPCAVRLRRDFGSLMFLIQAHALLHGASRKRNARGEIVAELSDYQGVYGLIDPILADGLGVTVTQTMRETVQAVRGIVTEKGTASVTDVAEALALDTSAASRRVHAAIDRGFVENEELQPRRKARLVVGASLPEERGILPPPAGLQVCAVDGGTP